MTRQSPGNGTWTVQDVLARLRSKVACKVSAAPHYTRYYSADASSYIVRPDIVVIPDETADVVRIIETATEAGIPVTPRGGGTGLVGGALNCGIIVDVKNLNSVRVTDQDTLVAGAGATKGKVDLALQPTGMMFAPNPSVGPFCTVGGMIGNNAAGARSLKYGSVIDNMISVTMIDGTGRTIRLPDDAEYGGRILEIADMTEGSKFPNVSKNSSGYRLDAVTSVADTHKVLAGSEGTLGIVVSAELKTVNRPRSRVLHMLEYETEAGAAADCRLITGNVTKPAAIEFVDREILNNMNQKFRDDTACLLLVEYEEEPDKKSGDDKSGSEEPDNHYGRTAGNGAPTFAQTGTVIGRVTPNAARITTITDESEIVEMWRYRNASLHYSLVAINEDSEERVPHVIEDATVPLAALTDLFAALHSINERYGTRTVTYGHAGNGNIHVRLICQRGDTRHLRMIAAEYFGRVIASGGSITGEHGDGLARSEFVPMQYGPKNIEQFAKLKKLFDPSGIMNPGKILAGKKSVLDQKSHN